MKISPLFSIVLLTGLLASATTSTLAEEKNDGPDVTHFPTLVGYRGQPIPIYAEVKPKNESIESVSLHVAESPGEISTRIPMLSSREDHYNGTIAPALVGASDKIWYFIASYDTSTNLTQTRWFPITIKNPDTPSPDAEHIPVTGSSGSTGSPLPPGETTGLSYGGFGYKEGAIVGGAVLGGVIVASAVSGGGGGGSGFDDSNTVSVPASGRSSGGFSSAPQDRVIDGTGAIRGRSIRGVRVTLNYEAYFVPDRFQIVYEGSVIGDTGNISGNGTIQESQRGSSAVVIIRVLTPQGGTVWDWSATVEYSVEDVVE